MEEIAWGQRTWFGTLTLNPDAHYRMEARARAYLDASCADMGSLSHNIHYVHQEISKEITLWLKRIRKNSGASFRYVIVAELHKSGRLHYHLLLTETPNSRPVRHKLLKEQWKLGFSAFKLVSETDKAARYVSKYLAKSSLARVRASRAYGCPPARNDVTSAAKAIAEQDTSRRGPCIAADFNALHGTLVNWRIEGREPSSASGVIAEGSTSPPSLPSSPQDEALDPLGRRQGRGGLTDEVRRTGESASEASSQGSQPAVWC